MIDIWFTKYFKNRCKYNWKRKTLSVFPSFSLRNSYLLSTDRLEFAIKNGEKLQKADSLASFVKYGLFVAWQNRLLKLWYWLLVVL